MKLASNQSGNRDPPQDNFGIKNWPPLALARLRPGKYAQVRLASPYFLLARVYVCENGTHLYTANSGGETLS